MKIQTREYYRSHYSSLKREKEENKRWERFLIDRTLFYEELERTLDVWELMQRNIGERE